MIGMRYEGWKVGRAIRKLRQAHDMTLEQMSEAVDKSTSHINQIELGSRKMSVDLLYELMSLFEVDVNSILGIEDKKYPGVITGAGMDNEVSVDKVLDELQPELRQYFKFVFIQMIRNCPVSCMCDEEGRI